MRNKRIQLIYILFFVSVAGVFSLTKITLPVTTDQIINIGINKIYALEFDEAESLFDSLMAIDPHNPDYVFFKSVAVYWKSYITRDELDWERFLSLTKVTIELANKKLDLNEHDSQALFYLGGAYGYRAICYGLYLDKNMEALLNAQKAYKYLSQALREDSLLYDVYLGYGIFHYKIDRLPAAVKLLAAIFGFKGDSAKGLKELDLASEKGKYTQTEALWWLSLFHASQMNFEKSLKYLEIINNKFPDNPIILYQIARNCQEIGYTEKAFWEYKQTIRYLNEFSTNSSVDLRKCEVFLSAHYFLAWSYFNLNQFSEATNQGRLLINWIDGKNDWKITGANYLIGYAFEMLGRRDSAIVYYERVKNYNNDQDYHNAKRALKYPLSDFDRVLIRGRNLFFMKNYEEAINEYQNYLRQGTDSVNINAKKMITKIYYNLAMAYYEKKQYRESIIYFKEVIEYQMFQPGWLLPWSCYRIGRVYNQLGENEKANQYFKQALQYKNYENESLLRKLIKEINH